MAGFFFETDPPDAAPPEFGGPADVIVHFMSFAFATRYGSQHDLSKLALHLRSIYKIDMRPLTTFADRNVEDEQDAKELERVWQDAAPLAESLRRINEIIDSGDARVAAMLAETPDLPARLYELQLLAERAAERGARVRLTFEL